MNVSSWEGGAIASFMCTVFLTGEGGHEYWLWTLESVEMVGGPIRPILPRLRTIGCAWVRNLYYQYKISP